MLRIAVDVGGTFTDAIASEEDGRLLTVKIRSTPKSPEEGFLSAVSLLLSGDDLPSARVSDIVHVGTIGTNLFLGQIGLKLPKVALITTKGFRDILEIGRQNRSELYNIFFQRPPPLIPRKLRLEVPERVDSSGNVMQPVSRTDLETLASELGRQEVDAVAISFLNCYANPANEEQAHRILSENLQSQVFASSEVDPEHREYERTSTTVVNAVLAPIVSRYLQSAHRELRKAGVTCDMQILSSAGGLVDAEVARNKPIVTIESGPAAGVVGSAEIAKLLGIRQVISFDMGGTSAKAGCVVDYTPLVVPEAEVGGKVHMGRTVKGSGYPVRSPCIDLAEVSAGGGTILWADETGTLKVGPISAGADPGPACYNIGGENATITDANLVLGRIGTELLGGKLELNKAVAQEALQRVGRKTDLDPDHVAAASLKLVNLQMAKAVYIVSLERGHDPRQFTLLSFGGAGPMHAAELADEVGIGTVIIPPWPGLFSALSMLLSDVRYTYVKGILAPLDESAEDKVERLFVSMANKAVGDLERRGVDLSKASILRTMDLRYAGQGYELEIPTAKPFNRVAAVGKFEERHQAVYGYKQHGEELEVTAIRLTIVLPVKKVKLGGASSSDTVDEDRLLTHRKVWFDGGWYDTSIRSRGSLSQKSLVKGPAIIEEYDSTLVVPPQWNCESTDAGCLILRRVAA